MRYWIFCALVVASSFFAADALACATCRTVDGCATCEETYYDGYQDCELRDFRGTTICRGINGLCEGPGGSEPPCAGYCGPYLVLLEDAPIAPAEHLKLASVTILPPVPAKS